MSEHVAEAAPSDSTAGVECLSAIAQELPDLRLGWIAGRPTQYPLGEDTTWNHGNTAAP